MAERERQSDSIWETWYDVLFNPADAMKTVAAGQRKVRSLLSLTVGIIPAWAVYAAVAGNISGVSGALMGLQLLTEMILWICGAAFLHMVSVLSGGRGEAAGLLCTLGYTALPQLFLIPVIAVAQWLPAGLSVFTLAAGLAVLVCWSFALKVLAIRGSYGFTTAKSLAVLLSPVIVMAGIAVTFLLFGISALTMLF